MIESADERPFLEETTILDCGHVALMDHCADDLSVVNSARVSFNKYHKEMEEGDDKLIGFLLKNRHGTPFEHNYFRFRIKAPIFIFREWHRHRIGHSYNEWSARYSELENDFYIPDFVRTQVGKPGNYTYVAAPLDMAEWFTHELVTHSQNSFDLYKRAIKNGIAREQARLFLPVNIYSEMYWSCNARSLMAFLSLRNHDKAQWEIQQYAQVVEEYFAFIMPITHRYFVEYGRQAP